MSVIEQYTMVPDNLLALLSKYRVVVPGIQRHYVQGANNSKAQSIRKQFVKDIFNAIDKGRFFKLHFIYGPIDTNGEDAFVPVDGQQRLTTLWLITRYAVELIENPVRKDLLRLLSRFTYEDRINAKRFCMALTNIDSRWDVNNNPISEIVSQSWFLDYWKEDETVASMVRMLSTIHCEWQMYNLTAEQVLEAIGTTISFELKIDSFSDDIYMKMNARGLQLTQWENFKSKFSESLGEYKKTWEKEMENLSNLFFTCSAEQYELPDNSFYALYARVIVYEMGKSNSSESIRKLSNFVNENWQLIELPFVPYTDFLDIVGNGTSLYNVANTCVEMLQAILEHNRSIVPYFGHNSLFDTFFHPRNNNDIDFTLCCYEYFKTFKNVDGKHFMQALRLIWNILENVNRQDENPYNRVAIIKRFIELANPSLYSAYALDKFTNADAGQTIEEATKANKMHDEDQNKPKDWDECKLGDWIDWQHAIEYAESLYFFNGSIRFLYRNSHGESTWENFATKLCNCIDLFCNTGLKDNQKVEANKAFISHCKKWETIRRIPVFDARKENWKRILTSSLSDSVNKFLLSPYEIAKDYDKLLCVFLKDNTIWDNCIKNICGYVLEWKGPSPSLWLNRYLSCTLMLTRNNREDILDEFMSNADIQFEESEEDRFVKIDGINYYYCVPIFFIYQYKGKKYRFAWQTWGWLDMYNKHEKLFDKYNAKYGEGFNIKIVHNGDSSNTDYAYYLRKIEECIDKYERFISEILRYGDQARLTR